MRIKLPRRICEVRLLTGSVRTRWGGNISYTGSLAGLVFFVEGNGWNVRSLWDSIRVRILGLSWLLHQFWHKGDGIKDQTVGWWPVLIISYMSAFLERIAVLKFTQFSILWTIFFSLCLKKTVVSMNDQVGFSFFNVRLGHLIYRRATCLSLSKSWPTSYQIPRFCSILSRSPRRWAIIFILSSSRPVI